MSRPSIRASESITCSRCACFWGRRRIDRSSRSVSSQNARSKSCARRPASKTPAPSVNRRSTSKAPGQLSGSWSRGGRLTQAQAEPQLSHRRCRLAPGPSAFVWMRGRWITPEDRADSPRVLVVNQTMARRFFPDSDPIGARYHGVDSPAQTPLTIVGVVADVATNGLERAETPAAYGPHTQRVQPFLRWLTFVVRTEGDPAAVAGALRAGVQTVDPRQPIFAVRTMDEIVARSLAERRFSLLLMAAFAGLTVILATLLAGCSRSASSSAGVRSACACRSARPAEGVQPGGPARSVDRRDRPRDWSSPPATRSAAWSSR